VRLIAKDSAAAIQSQLSELRRTATELVSKTKSVFGYRFAFSGFRLVVSGLPKWLTKR
jgi:hypothetical protein